MATDTDPLRLARGLARHLSRFAGKEFRTPPGYGQLLHEIDFEGRVTQYLYDNSASGRGRLVARRYFESTSAFNGGAGTPERVISTRYDAFGRQALTRPPPDPLRLARGAARDGRGPSQRLAPLPAGRERR